jgi:hypothetical protein
LFIFKFLGLFQNQIIQLSDLKFERLLVPEQLLLVSLLSSLLPFNLKLNCDFVFEPIRDFHLLLTFVRIQLFHLFKLQLNSLVFLFDSTDLTV